MTMRIPDSKSPRASARGAVASVGLGALMWLLATSAAQAQPTDAAPAKAAVCMACHGGADGKTMLPVYPSLNGQTARYLFLELRDFKAGRRSNPLMSPMAADLTSEDMHALADWFAKQKPQVQTYAADQGKATLGRAKSDETLCSMCHLGGLLGQNEIPRLAGQNFDYLVKQLTDFKAHTRTNDGGNMTSVAGTLSADDIQNLANYIVGL